MPTPNEPTDYGSMSAHELRREYIRLVADTRQARKELTALERLAVDIREQGGELGRLADTLATVRTRLRLAVLNTGRVRERMS